MIFTQEDFDFSHVRDYEMQVPEGVVVVEMHPRPEKKGLLELPDDVRTQVRSDLAIVVASGEEEIPVWSAVYVRHDRGKCVKGFGWDESFARSETRFYGINGGFDFAGTGETTECNKYDVSEAVLCFHNMRPIGKNILIKLAPKDEKVGSILVEKKHQQRDPVAEVIAVGGGTSGFYQPGDKVVIHEGAIDGHELHCLDAEGFEDHALIREEFIYGKRV